MKNAVNRRLALVLAVLLCILLFILYQILYAPNTFEEDRFVLVSKGETFQQVMDSLEMKGVIRNRTLFSMAGRILRLTTRMQVGKYRFRSGMSNKEILEDLRYGKTIEMITVTIPEGLRASRHALYFARHLGIDSSRYMELFADTNFARGLGVTAPTLEGYLMPNTYRFYWQTMEEDIIREQVRMFWTVYNDSLQQRTQSLGSSINDILALASIVEGETSVDSERTVIAGVYYNRLQKRMRLQADPTIQYILEDGPRRLKYSDLHRESPYNTYRYAGLPPGPINNPGAAAIHAALYPKKHKYLFFVATGQGGHTFTRTFQEHLKAIQAYRKKRQASAIAKEEMSVGGK